MLEFTLTRNLTNVNIAINYYKRSVDLTIHVRNHAGKRPYKCKQCDKRYKQSSELTSHLEIYTDTRPYKCKQSDKRFTINITQGSWSLATICTTLQM